MSPVIVVGLCFAGALVVVFIITVIRHDTKLCYDDLLPLMRNRCAQALEERGYRAEDAELLRRITDDLL
jgi:hypothetical protein